PAVIDVEEEFGGMGDMHGAEYKAELRSCKHPNLRSSAAHATGVLRLASSDRLQRARAGFVKLMTALVDPLYAFPYHQKDKFNWRCGG
ncbi:hypothetical protein SAMN05216516_11045, partial [Izhakiella capsodis]